MKPPKNPAAVALGRLGGKAGTGDSKRRKVTSEQAKAAVAVRWARYRAAKQAASRRNGRKGGRPPKLCPWCELRKGRLRKIRGVILNYPYCDECFKFYGVKGGAPRKTDKVKEVK